MKKYRILIFLIIMLMLMSMYIVPASAVESGYFYIFTDESAFSCVPGETWKECIDEWEYTDLTYDDEYVYYNGLRIWSFPGNTMYVTPTDKVYSTYYGLENYDGFQINGICDAEGQYIKFFCFNDETWKNLIDNTESGLHPEQGFTCDDIFVYYNGTVIAGVNPGDVIIHANEYNLCPNHEIEDLPEQDMSLYCYCEGCLSCGYVNSRYHDFVYDNLATEENTYYAECRLCGYSYYQTCDHEYQDVTGYEDDYCYYMECIKCGYFKVQDHDYIVRSGSPSCVTNTIIEYECCNVGCGYILKEELAKLPHTFDEGAVIEYPTCTDVGIREYTCEVCGYTYQATIHALGHDKNIWGNCKREGCANNTSDFKLDFSWLTDWFSKAQDNIEEWTEDVIGGDTTTPTDDPIEEIKDLLDKSGQFIEKLISLIMGAVVGYIVVKCIPIVVAFFKGLFGINDKR